MEAPRTTPIDPPRRAVARRLRSAAQVAGVLTALTGAGFLVAWLVGAMAASGRSTVTVKTNCALALLLSGAGLSLLAPAQTGPARRWAGRACAVLALFLGAMTLGEHVFGWDLGIDQLLAQEPAGALGTLHPNRMGPPASISFVLAAASLLLLHASWRRAPVAVQGLAIGVCLIALFGMLGHLFGAEEFFAVARRTTIAWPTSAALLALGIGLLCTRPEGGPMAQVLADDPGGAMMRWLLAPLVLLAALGWIRVVGERWDWYDTATGTGLLVISFGAVLSVVTYVASRRLSRSWAAERDIHAALRESESRFRATYEQAAVGIEMVDLRGRLIRGNGVLQHILGYREDELAGRTFADITHPDDLPAEQALLEQLLAGRISQYTIAKRYLRKDGDPVWVRVTSSLVRPGEGEPYRVSIIEDITEQKRAEEELRRLHADLERRVEQRTAELAAANRELEAFTYTVSHDLRAPLRHVTGFVELLEKHAGATFDEKAKRYVRIISEAAQRMGGLIDDLLVLSRIGRAVMTETAVDLRHLVDEACQELASEINGRMVQWEIGPLPTVQGDPVLLRSVVVNLLSNAVKYSRDRAPARIEIGSREDNGEVVVFVRDNGAGFDMRFVDKLFGVFQRLHRAEDFEGTGIGLASVRRIIQRHGGKTWAEGEPGRGATFYFSLPARPLGNRSGS